MYKWSSSTNHGDKVQQVHPRFVGFGVGQREEGRQLEPHSVAGVAALKNKQTHIKMIKDEVLILLLFLLTTNTKMICFTSKQNYMFEDVNTESQVPDSRAYSLQLLT